MYQGFRTPTHISTNTPLEMVSKFPIPISWSRLDTVFVFLFLYVHVFVFLLAYCKGEPRGGIWRTTDWFAAAAHRRSRPRDNSLCFGLVPVASHPEVPGTVNGFPWVSRATPQEEAAQGTTVSGLASCPIGRFFLSGIVNGFREFLWVSLGYKKTISSA